MRDTLNKHRRPVHPGLSFSQYVIQVDASLKEQGKNTLFPDEMNEVTRCMNAGEDPYDCATTIADMRD